MRFFIILILNVFLLTALLIAGLALFFWLALMIIGALAYLWLQQKLTGRKPLFMHISVFRKTDHSAPPIIEAEYRKIDEE